MASKGCKKEKRTRGSKSAKVRKSSQKRTFCLFETPLDLDWFTFSTPDILANYFYQQYETEFYPVQVLGRTVLTL